MTLTTIISLIAAAITIGTTLFFVVKRIIRLVTKLESRISELENALKVYPIFKTKDRMLCRTLKNDIVEIEQNTEVKIKSIDGHIADFETVDGLMYGSAPLDDFEKCENDYSKVR